MLTTSDIKDTFPLNSLQKEDSYIYVCEPIKELIVVSHLSVLCVTDTLPPSGS